MADRFWFKKTDQELVALSIKNADNYLFLMQRYEKQLLSYIQNIALVTKEDAEDILQESFIKAYKNLNDFDQNLKFSSWLFRIVHNETISHFRRFKNKPQFKTTFKSDELIKLIQDEKDPLKIVIGKNEAEIINQVLDGLKPIYREVLILKYFDDKGYAEISDILQKPQSTIGTLLHRARKIFKDKIIQLKINL